MSSPDTVVVAHGGGPTAVINASLAGVITSAQRSGVGRVLCARGGIEGLLREDFIDVSGIDDGRLDLLRRTPASAIGSCRYKVRPEDHDRIVDVLDRVGARVFLYNGGNDSMDTCQKVSDVAREVKVIGIPKTIDNDLEGTDHCPGFGSAARYYIHAAAELALDVQALPIHVCVLEIMGRNAGWLTAASGLGRVLGLPGPEMLVLPETPFDASEFLSEVEFRWSRSGGFVVAAGEGVRTTDGRLLMAGDDDAHRDAFGHPLPGGASQYLADIITQKLGIRARAEKPGLLARASAAHRSTTDADEAFHVGVHAVDLALAGHSGRMVTIQRHEGSDYAVSFDSIPLGEVANRERTLPADAVEPASSLVSNSFLAYARPLIGEDVPRYFRLEDM